MAGIDIEKLAEILRDAAKAEVLPRFRRLDPSQIKQKSEAIDLVTEADVAAEEAIKRAVADLAPAAVFIGEEGVAADPGLIDALPDAELAIVVDPIDGTANFAAGMPLFAVMAAVVANGETIAGIIYDPMGDDWVMAERGGGAWLKRPDGETISMKVADPVPLAQMVGTASVGFLPAEVRPRVLTNLAKVRIAASYRVAGHEYRTFAGGHLHYVMFNKLMPWDHLPGTLISQEAGAYVARFDGSPYLPQHNSGGILLATDKDSWQVLRDEVFTV